MDPQSAPNPSARQRRTQAHVLADYAGRGAANVADDLRRLGLRPGVQRVDATTPDEVGAILAQDPPAGASAARNTVVTLFVGAATHHTPTTDPQPSEDTTVAPGPRRRRKPRSLGTLDPAPPTSHGTAQTDRVCEHSQTDQVSADDEMVAAWPDNAGADADDELVGEDAPVGQWVHQDDTPRASTAPGDSAPVASPTTAEPTLETRALLTPLAGLPRRFKPKGLWRVLRRARLAIVSGTVCVLALLAIALAGHNQPPHHGVLANRPTVSHPAVIPHRDRNPHEASRPHRRVHPRAPRHDAHHQANRPPHVHRPRSSTAVTPAQPAPQPAPQPSLAPVSQAATPAVLSPVSPAAGGPVVAGGQIPGGPFSP
jgi:hypothetical protein